MQAKRNAAFENKQSIWLAEINQTRINSGHNHHSGVDSLVIQTNIIIELRKVAESKNLIRPTAEVQF